MTSTPIGDVTVARIETRERTDGSGNFMALIVTQKVLVKGQNGQPSLRSPEQSVPTDLDEAVALQLVGMVMPGAIVRVPRATYDWENPDGETIQLDYGWHYESDPKLAAAFAGGDFSALGTIQAGGDTVNAATGEVLEVESDEDLIAEAS